MRPNVSRDDSQDLTHHMLGLRKVGAMREYI